MSIDCLTSFSESDLNSNYLSNIQMDKIYKNYSYELFIKVMIWYGDKILHNDSYRESESPVWLVNNSGKVEFDVTSPTNLPIFIGNSVDGLKQFFQYLEYCDYLCIRNGVVRVSRCNNENDLKLGLFLNGSHTLHTVKEFVIGILQPLQKLDLLQFESYENPFNYQTQGDHDVGSSNLLVGNLMFALYPRSTIHNCKIPIFQLRHVEEIVSNGQFNKLYASVPFNYNNSTKITTSFFNPQHCVTFVWVAIEVDPLHNCQSFDILPDGMQIMVRSNSDHIIEDKRSFGSWSESSFKDVATINEQYKLYETFAFQLLDEETYSGIDNKCLLHDSQSNSTHPSSLVLSTKTLTNKYRRFYSRKIIKSIQWKM